MRVVHSYRNEQSQIQPILLHKMQAPGCVRRPLRQRTSAQGKISCLHINENLVPGQAWPRSGPTSLTKTSLRPLSSSSLTASESDVENCADQSGIVHGIDRLLRTSSISCRSEAFAGPDDRPLGVEVAIHEYERGEYSTPSMEPTLTPLPLRPHATSNVEALPPGDTGLPRTNASEPGCKSEKSSSQLDEVEPATGLVQREQDGCDTSQPISVSGKESRHGLLLEQNCSTVLDLASEDSLAHGPFLMERNNAGETTSPALSPGEGIFPQRPLPADWIEMLRAAIPQAHHLVETHPSHDAHIHPALRQIAHLTEPCKQEDPFGSGKAQEWDVDRSPRFPPGVASSPPTPRHIKQLSRQSIVSSFRSPSQSQSLLRRRHSLFTSASAYEQERNRHPSQLALNTAVTEREPHQASGRKDENSAEGASSNLGSFSSISSFLAYNSFSSQPLRSSSTIVPRSSISSFSTEQLHQQQSIDSSVNSSRTSRVLAQPDPYMQRSAERRSSLQLNSLPHASRSFDQTRENASLEAALKSAVFCALDHCPGTRPLTSMQEESPSVTSRNSSGRPKSRQQKPPHNESRHMNLAPKDETYRRAQSLLFAQRPTAKRGPSNSGSKDYASRRSSDHGSRQHPSVEVSRSFGDGAPADGIESDNMKQCLDQTVKKPAGGGRKRVSGVGSDVKRGLKRLLG